LWLSLIQFAIKKANFLVVDPEWQEKAKEYTHLQRLKLMEELWLMDFWNSAQYFSQAFRLSAIKDIQRYLQLANKEPKLPSGNWLYFMSQDGTLYTNPLWNENL